MCAACLTGCGKKEGEVSAAQEEQRDGALVLRPGVFQTNPVERSYLDLPPDEVMVQVGSRKLTRALFDERVNEWLDLNRRSGPLMQRQDESRLRWRAISYVFNNSMARAALLEEADARKTVPGTNALRSAETHMEVLAKRLGGRKMLVRRLAGGEEAVAARTREEAVLKELVDSEWGDRLDAKDAEAKALRDELMARSEATVATNLFLFSVMTNLRERVVSGGLCVTGGQAVARAELPEGVVCSGVQTQIVFNLNDEKAAKLAGLKAGECSEVFEADDRFMFVQLLLSAPDKETPDMSSYVFAEVEVPRDAGWEVPSLAKSKRDIASQRRMERMEPWVQGLIRKAGVVYPNGIHLFDEVNPELRRPPARQSRRGQRPAAPDAGSAPGNAQ